MDIILLFTLLIVVTITIDFIGNVVNSIIVSILMFMYLIVIIFSMDFIVSCYTYLYYETCNYTMWNVDDCIEDITQYD